MSYDVDRIFVSCIYNYTIGECFDQKAQPLISPHGGGDGYVTSQRMMEWWKISMLV